MGKRKHIDHSDSQSESERDSQSPNSDWVDTDELVSNGVKAIGEMSPRRHNDNRNELHTCRCGALVNVPKGHTVLEDDDKEVECHDCDKPLGVKLYENV